MSYSYSAHSTGQRATLHPHMQNIFDNVLEAHDFRIEQGSRTAQQQQEAFDHVPKRSKQRGFNEDGSESDFPHKPRGPEYRSHALDVTPYVDGKPINAAVFGTDAFETARWGYFAGIVEAEARAYFRKVFRETGEQWRIRWGGNWNRDAKILDKSDQRFIDAYHFEMEKVMA